MSVDIRVDTVGTAAGATLAAVLIGPDARDAQAQAPPGPVRIEPQLGPGYGATLLCSAPQGTSGDAAEGEPGSAGFGTLKQGALEGSNVQAVEEMVDMISASRAYQNNVEVMNTSKELMLATLKLGS